jgi:RNA polymerase sigma factor for flagellar operon FliA
MSVGELRRLASDMRMSKVTSIHRPLGSEEGEFTVADTLVAGDSTDLAPQMNEAAGLIASGLDLIPEHERTLMQMIYVKAMPLKDIARVLEVTESWVSLLHTRAMVNLQRALAGQPV